ncbi:MULTISPECIES: hypothetical protein [Xanthomonas]|uniref:Lipoprotein n=2 Tax=Xanthomonas TaxID=338 RepID=A0AA46Y958_9XANT|nr:MULTISPECIES: hypothetical protein [Xanthomonas]AJC46805.1 lipoprotein [Xanthomonas sacchari]KAA8918739.1 hypothetical protein CEK64_16185 [Xanthomonas sontii]KAB7772975.1 hypothetical protein CEK69_05995 [Xanthomonas sp. LMG 12462]MCW0368348.1 hypothetical protein [Xanthomonas sacchari]MCW0376760.1 hypothetical protein [Xanthomonas sacchari]
MKLRLICAAGLLAALGGCATYDYAGGGEGGYYRGAPSVEYRYPAGYSEYYSPYGAVPYYGYGPSYYGYYGYGVPYYYYRGYDGPRHRPPPRPRPDDGGSRPPSPPPSVGGRVPTPWRDMDRLRRPDALNSAPRPQSMQPARPAMQRPEGMQRPPAPRPGNMGRSNGTRRTLEP